MIRRSQLAAICIVRAERQGEGLLISVSSSNDVESRSGQQLRRFADIDQAVAAVREFLELVHGDAAAGP